MLRDRRYYTTLLTIALPIITQNFISSLLNMIDVTMLGQLGEVSIAAVGLANQVFFLLTLMLFGANSGMGVFTAQLWGKRDVPSIHKVLGIGLLIGLSGSLVFTVLALVLPAPVLRIFTTDPAVIASGVSYLRIVGWSYMVTAVSFAFSSVLRSTGQVRVPMVVSIGALSLKTLLNYGLILGHFGLPALGVQGAAIATVIARVVEMTALLAIIYTRKLTAAARPGELLGFSRTFLSTVLKTSLPVLINETLWSLGVTMYNVVYGRIGTDAIAAVNIAASIENLAFVIFMGLSDATGIMVGNRIGAKEEDMAFAYGRQTLMISTIGAILIGVVILVGRDFILGFYNLTPESRLLARNILMVMGFALWVKVSNMTIIVGILRAGGDTRFSLFLDTGTVWLVGVPLAVLGGLVLHLPVYIVYLMVIGDEVCKYIIGVWRFSTKRWINNVAEAV
jgi:putative MATE family efflux protein